MTPRTMRIKLTVFAIVTCVSIAAVYLGYMRGLERAGIGVYDVSMKMPVAGGLYPNAQVSYRGVDIGVVETLDAKRDQVVAHLRLDSGREIPSDLDAYVRSTSAIGEQYVNLVPRPGASDGEILEQGAVIEDDRVNLPVSTANLLDRMEALLGSIDTGDLRATVEALGTAFGGTGDELESLIDSSLSLEEAATENLTPTMRLLDNIQPVLETQARTSPAVATYLRQLRKLTKVLVEHDGDIRALLVEGSPFLEQMDAELARLRPELPGLLADTWTAANVTSTYDGNIEHILTVLPAVVAGFQSVIPRDRLDDKMPLANLSFKANLNDSPLCTDGFPDHDDQRSPHDLSPAPDPDDSYCKVPADDPRIVRGARNIPCPDGTGRGAKPALCGITFPRFQATRAGLRAGLPTPATGVVFVDAARDVVRTSDGSTVPLASLATTGRADDLASLLLVVALSKN